MTTTTTTEIIVDRLYHYVEHEANTRSAWACGVREYALEIVESLGEMNLEADDFLAPKIIRKAMLNGAQDWQEYSEGGCSFIYDEDIAKRLCTPSELKRFYDRDGRWTYRNPNKMENWIDCQARALAQASDLIMRTINAHREQIETIIENNR